MNPYSHRSLAEVAARLESAALCTQPITHDPELLYEHYEGLAIAILDSEHAEHEPGLLERYLQLLLRLKRMELGLPECDEALQ